MCATDYVTATENYNSKVQEARGGGVGMENLRGAGMGSMRNLPACNRAQLSKIG